MSEGSAATGAAVSFRPVRKLCLVCGLLVGALLGIVLIAFAAFPAVYEAQCDFTLDCASRKSSVRSDYDLRRESGSYEEVYNTRLNFWRSEKTVVKIVQLYRTTYPTLTTPDQVLIDTIGRGSFIELLPHSRTLRIRVRSTSPQLAAALANLYAEAIGILTKEENRDRCDHAVAEITEMVKKQSRVDEDIARRLKDFRTKSKIDETMARRTRLEAKMQKTISEMLKLQENIAVATQKVSILRGIQLKPATFDGIRSSVAFSEVFLNTERALQKVRLEMNQLSTTHRKDDPAVKAKGQELQSAEAAFIVAVSNELVVTETGLGALTGQLQSIEPIVEQFNREQAQISRGIETADASLNQLEKEREVSAMMLKDLRQREQEARICVEQDFEVVSMVKRAEVPTQSVNFISKVFYHLTGGGCYEK